MICLNLAAVSKFHTILAVGLLVRLAVAWNSPLFVDEAFTYFLSCSEPYDLLLSAARDNHPLLFPMFAWVWSGFSSSPVWLRLPVIAAWAVSFTYFWRLAALVTARPWLPALGYTLSYGLWVSQTVYRANSLFEAAFLMGLWAAIQEFSPKSVSGQVPDTEPVKWLAKPRTWESWVALLLLPQLNYLGVVVLLYWTVRCRSLRAPALVSWIVFTITAASVFLLRAHDVAVPSRGGAFVPLRLGLCPCQDLGFEALAILQNSQIAVGLAVILLAGWVYSVRQQWANLVVRESLFVWICLLGFQVLLGLVKGGNWIMTRNMVYFGSVIWLSWGGGNDKLRNIFFGPVLATGLYAALWGPFHREFWTQDWASVRDYLAKNANNNDLVCIHPAYGAVGLAANGVGRCVFKRSELKILPTKPEVVPINETTLGPALEKYLEGHRLFVIFNQEENETVRDWFRERYLVASELDLRSRRTWGNFQVYLLLPKNSSPR